MNRSQLIFILCLLGIIVYIITCTFAPIVGLVIFVVIISVLFLTSIASLLVWIYQELGEPYHVL